MFVFLTNSFPGAKKAPYLRLQNGSEVRRIMYSKKLGSWLMTNCPSGKIIPSEEVEAIASQAGLHLENMREGIKISSHDSYIRFREEKIEVRWRKHIRSFTAIYTPFLNYSSTFGFEAQELLYRSAGLEPLVVRLPERVVHLPVPDWVDVNTYDPENSSLESTTCFLSEVDDIITSFLEKLTALKK